MTMNTHGIDLKEVKLIHYNQGLIKPPYLSMRTGRMIQRPLQIIKANLNIRGGRGRHCESRRDR